MLNLGPQNLGSRDPRLPSFLTRLGEMGKMLRQGPACKYSPLSPKTGVCKGFHGDLINYRRQTKLRKGNAFTPVCQSFCSQGGGVHPSMQTPPRQTHPPRAETSTHMATAADGTHPTGMHSCLTSVAGKFLI